MKPSRSAIQDAIALIGLAAAPAGALALDLAEAYQLALGNDALVASAREAVNAARARVDQSRAPMLPAVTGTGSASRQYADTNLAPHRTFKTLNYGVSMSLPLMRMQNYETWEQSKLQLSVSEAQYEQAMQDLIVRLGTAYFDVLAAQDNLTTIRAQKRAIREQLASAIRNFEVGTATVTDQQEAQARFDLNVAQELAAENDLQVKRAALSLLTARPSESLNALTRGVALREPEPAREPDWTSNARGYNLSVQQAQLATEIARREIEKQRFGHYPTLDLVSSVTHSENQTVQLVGVKTNSAAIGLQFSVPFYAGGGIDAKVREAVANNAKAASDLENARRQAEQSARASFLGVRSGLGQVRALEAAERSSQLALDSNLLGYQVGVRINIDVLNAQQQLFTTRRDLAKARYDVLINGLKLKQAAGTLTPADVAAVNALLGPPAPEVADAVPATPSPAPAAPATGVASGTPAAGTVPADPPPGARARAPRVMKPIPALPAPTDRARPDAAPSSGIPRTR